MGQTAAPLNLRWPEPTEDLRTAATAIRLLAEDVNSKHDPDVAVISRADSPTESPGGGAVSVVFPGAVAVLSGFTTDQTRVTRTGPPRLFLLDVEVETEIGSAVGMSQQSSLVEVALNLTPFTGSHDEVNSTDGTLGVRRYTHRISTPVAMGTGEFLSVNLSGTPGVRAGVVGLRLYPIGPEGAV